MAALALGGVLHSQPADTGDYELVDNIEGAHVQLAAFPVRPMAVVELAGGDELWAVNHHDSKLVRFDLGNAGSGVAYQTAWLPVSVAHWSGADELDESDDEILVVSRGSWSVQRHRRTDGALLGVIQMRPGSSLPDGRSLRQGLMSEPADILVDSSTDMAFVSCPGSDSVLQLDLLATGSPFVELFHRSSHPAFRIKSPLFLSFDANQNVLVTPMHSGNNTLWVDNLVQPNVGPGLNSGTQVIDLSPGEPHHSPNNDFPDEDLFRLVPATNAGSYVMGGVSALAEGKELGTLLFAHGFNEAVGDGRLWVLNTEARNADEPGNGQQGEPLMVGDFVENRITRVDLATGARDFVSLDPYGSLVGAGEGVGQPYALDFNEFGLAFVAGLLSDNVTLVSNSGAWSMEVELDSPNHADRILPRAVLSIAAPTNREGTFLVYAWGTNEILTYDFDAAALSSTRTLVYELGHDPTPQLERDGRSLFFDGTRSAHGQISCASCHVEGGSDLLAWNLSKNFRETADELETISIDDKGGMITQTMVGLERLAPFHWRGERNLEDFNTFAFEGLLGHPRLSTEGDPSEFDQFEAFVFSLRNPANPNQNRARVLDNDIEPNIQVPIAINTNATEGQKAFRDELSFGQLQFRCNDCHSMPTGTNNDLHDEVFGISRPRRSHLKPTPFHELWRREGEVIQVRADDPATPGVNDDYDLGDRNYMGTGIGHVGVFSNLFDFVDAVTGLSPQQIYDITAFIHQWDQGLAPAVHYAFHLNANTQTQATLELRAYLELQASLRNCDIAVVGQVDLGNGLVERRWTYDREANPGVFRSDHGETRAMVQFLAQANSESNLFLGLPVGMAERFAIDEDMDGVRNDTDPDSDDPNVPGGQPNAAFVHLPQVSWVTARVARIHFETDRPTTAVVKYRRRNTSAPWFETHSANLTRAHSVMLSDLLPSTNDGTALGASGIEWVNAYEVEVEVSSVGQTTPTVEPAMVVTENFIEPEIFDPDTDREHQRLFRHMLTSTEWVSGPTLSGGIVSGTIEATVALQRGVRHDASTGAVVRLPAEDRVLVGRLVIPQAEPLIPAQVIQPDALSGLLQGDAVRIDDSSGRLLQVDGSPSSDGDGPYLVSAAASVLSGGQAVVQIPIQFTAADYGLVLGDELLFVVDAVVESGRDENDVLLLPVVSGNEVHIPSRTGSDLAWTGWIFPETKEEHAEAHGTIAQP